MLDEVKRIAPLWNPNLDDGVVLTMAPLWRLVPQCKPWQKELKAKWAELAAGKYDWAHLAMHLWPERVVPKCATDRSLAIAHGLGALFWERESAASEKWLRKDVAREVVDRLTADRTSPAVKDALKSLLEAPAPVTSRGARRKTTARPASGSGSRRLRANARRRRTPTEASEVPNSEPPAPGASAPDSLSGGRRR